MDQKEFERFIQLLDENCEQVMDILNTYEDGSQPYALVSHVLAPIFEEIIDLKDKLLADTVYPENKDDPTEAAQSPQLQEFQQDKDKG